MSAAEDDGAEYIGELAELHHEKDQLLKEHEEDQGVIRVWRGRAERAEAERDNLRAACELAVFACRENLAMRVYKNEPLLLKALTACENALKHTEHQHGG